MIWSRCFFEYYSSIYDHYAEFKFCFIMFFSTNLSSFLAPPGAQGVTISVSVKNCSSIFQDQNHSQDLSFMFSQAMLSFIHAAYFIRQLEPKILRLVLKSRICVCLRIPSEGCVKCLYIEKEWIPGVWTVFLIFVVTTVFVNNKRLLRLRDS